ncbi:MAG: carbon-nitrogen hydrolase family protein [Chloroflexi bacterium]|nr:carbon-nitrogen hydrolase family protein [Chloroflexota bacterium]
MSALYNLPSFRAAAVQAGQVVRDAPEWFDTEATLDKAIRLVQEAAANGAKLIVFPECWLPCYPYWSLDMADRPTFRKIWAKLLWSSVEVPGPETEALCRAAKRANACIVMGINERDPKYRGRMYNTILYIGPTGELLGMHRKISITFQERFFHTPGDGGANLRTVFRTGLGNIGGSICGEHAQLTQLYSWIMQGMQIHCSLWPGSAGLETITDIETRAACYTAGAFGILAATYIAEPDRPKNFYRNSLFSASNGWRGGSGIVSPFGEYIAGPVYDKETIVYADIDLGDTDRSRDGVNLSGIYSRWDLLSLNLREETYEPLVEMGNKRTPQAAPESQYRELEARLARLEQQIAEMSRNKAEATAG